jgi:multimeric flavodoxin WrbA
MKVGAAIVSCRRTGNSAVFEQLNQFFGINGMPTVPSTYWNDVHGYHKEDVMADEEGVETIQNLSRNMAFLMQSIIEGKDAHGLPDTPHAHFTNFIR